MSFSRLSRGTHFFSCTKSHLRQTPILSSIFQSRNLLDVVGSRYNFFSGANNMNVYKRPFGLDSRGFMSKHGYKVRSYSPQESCYVIFGRRYSTHAATEKKSKKMLLYLTGLVFAMVGCTYAAVPLYQRFCQATGYGGTVQRREMQYLLVFFRVLKKRLLVIQRMELSHPGRLLCSSMLMCLMGCPGNLFQHRER
ncbi:hypothetical protein ACS0TY_029548 [Phlomoides rotata]